MGTTNTVVEVAAALGTFDAIITLVIAGFVSLLFIIIGIYLFAKRNIIGGVILVVLAFLVMLVAYLYYYFVTSNRNIAAAAGTIAVANVLVGGFKDKVLENVKNKTT